MSTFLRGLALLTAITCLTWITVLWRWQHADHDISMSDVVAYLVMLPLVITVLLLALRWAWRSASARAAAMPAATVAPAAAKSAGATHADSAPKLRRVLLANAAVCSPAALDANALLETAESGEPLPCPDVTLLNDAGLPVLSARIEDDTLALESLHAELEKLLPDVRQRHPEWQSLVPEPYLVRALAALRQPLLEQQRYLSELAQATPVNPDEHAAGATHRSSPTMLPSVRLLIGCPAGWTAFDQALAREWGERLMANADVALTSAYTLSAMVVAGSGDELWLKAGQFFDMAATAVRTDWLLLAACHSAIDQAAIDVLSSQQRLYDSRDNPAGQIPGEAGVALLLCSDTWHVPQGFDASPVALHLPAMQRREAAVESPGRVTHATLDLASSHALRAANCEAATVAAAVCDADLHSPRAPELYGLTIALLPHLDPIADLRVLGKISGHVGAASALLVIAAASAWVKDSAKSVLALGMADSHLRLATLVVPFDAPNEGLSGAPSDAITQ